MADRWHDPPREKRAATSPGLRAAENFQPGRKFPRSTARGRQGRPEGARLQRPLVTRSSDRSAGPACVTGGARDRTEKARKRGTPSWHRILHSPAACALPSSLRSSPPPARASRAARPPPRAACPGTLRISFTPPQTPTPPPRRRTTRGPSRSARSISAPRHPTRGRVWAWTSTARRAPARRPASASSRRALRRARTTTAMGASTTRSGPTWCPC